MKGFITVLASLMTIFLNPTSANEMGSGMSWQQVISLLESGSSHDVDLRLKKVLKLAPLGESSSTPGNRRGSFQTYTSELLPGTVTIQSGRNRQLVVLFQFESPAQIVPASIGGCVRIGEIEGAALHRGWEGGLYGDPIDGSIRRYILSSDQRRVITLIPYYSSIQIDGCVKALRAFLPNDAQETLP